MAKQKVNWTKAVQFVLETLEKIERELEDFSAKHPGWRWWADFINYPPQILLCFEHEPVADRRRAEAYDNGEARLAILNEGEIEVVSTLVGEIAERHKLRAKKVWLPRGSDRGKLIYTLKPHYWDFIESEMVQS